MSLMIYGAAGYTGRMVAEHAKAVGLDFIVAGRDPRALGEVAARFGVASRVFSLDEADTIAASLSGISVLLNCAGPFMRTAEPLMRAAIEAGVHYLDFAAELDSYKLAEVLDADARAAGVMLLPGSGGSVAMLGSLAGHAAKRVARPCRISIALHVAGSMSRGSAISANENLTAETLARVDHRLEAIDPAGTRLFDFGAGPVDCFALTLPDLITIWHATGVANIETFVHVSANAFPPDDLATLPDGPSEAHLLANRYQAAVEVAGEDGVVARAILDTVNGYTFTALAAAEAARRVLSGEFRPGFQTPASLFGTDFAETIADTTILDL
jgi:short subunit dehydrogenase-like uncharacterized protein